MTAGLSGREESPDSTRQRCRVTPGGGNPRESATENSLLRPAGVRVKRWGKSPPRDWQQDRHGKPHREQCRIGIARGGRFGRELRDTARRPPWPRDPGWQLDACRQRHAKRNGHPAPQGVDRIRLTGPPRIIEACRKNLTHRFFRNAVLRSIVARARTLAVDQVKADRFNHHTKGRGGFTQDLLQPSPFQHRKPR